MTNKAQEALKQSSVNLALFFEGAFKGGYFLRLWSGQSSINWNGHEWLGSGYILSIGDTQNSDRVVASHVPVILSGIPTELVQKSFSDVQIGASGKIWLAPLTDTGDVIADPFLIFQGRLDAPSSTDAANECTIELIYETRAIDLNRIGGQRYNHEGQQALYPGDLGFEFVAGLQDKEIVWGRAS